MVTFFDGGFIKTNDLLFSICRLPFNWKDPVFYALAMTVEYSITMVLFYFIACLISLKIGTLLFSIAISEDIKRSLHSINTISKRKAGHARIFTHLVNFVESHVEAKQLSNTQKVDQ